jgi:hypothetical protein
MCPRSRAVAVLSAVLFAGLGCDVRSTAPNAPIAAEDAEGARRVTLLATLSILDLKLRHRTAAATDLDLLDVWARQLVVDAEAGDQGSVIGDAASIRWIRDRVARDLSPSELQALDARLNGLRAAVTARNLGAAGVEATGLRAAVAQARAGRP